jgi:FkbM family methyltransferase
MIRDFSKHILAFWHEPQFVQVRWVWGDVWKTWYLQNQDHLEEKMGVLKLDLDNESCSIIDTICERLFFICPWQRYSDKALYHRSLLVSEIEKKQQSEIHLNYNLKETIKKYKLPITYYPPAIFYYDDGLKFVPTEVLSQIINKDFIDGGAWIGDSALTFLQYNPNRVFSFEPLKTNYELLQKTIELGQFQDKIIPVKMGLGASDTTVVLYGDATDASIHKEVLEINTVKERQVKETVKITSIDNFVSSNGIIPGLIKLDIEGNELDTIKGGMETIRKYKPVLIISIYHTPVDFFEIKPLIISHCPGYTFLVRRLDPAHPTAETILIGYYKK